MTYFPAGANVTCAYIYCFVDSAHSSADGESGRVSGRVLVWRRCLVRNRSATNARSNNYSKSERGRKKAVRSTTNTTLHYYYYYKINLKKLLLLKNIFLNTTTTNNNNNILYAQSFFSPGTPLHPPAPPTHSASNSDISEGEEDTRPQQQDEDVVLSSVVKLHQQPGAGQRKYDPNR